ncbi:MAG: HAD family hydrolase [Acidobacteria bacterium]|nr:HAD family hydrolase [Acidobacteriota bacterium]
MKSAVFLDRDGTISEEVGYVNHVDRFKIYPWSAEAIRRLNEAGLRVFVVTNQSGVARGYFPEELVRQVNGLMVQALAQRGARIDGIYYCPHHPDGREGAFRRVCDCRKPSPGLLERAARDHALDLAASFVVGDRYLDIETGFRVGTRGVLVLSGYGKGEYLYQRATWPRPPDHVAEDLAEAAEWILANQPAPER